MTARNHRVYLKELTRAIKEVNFENLSQISELLYVAWERGTKVWIAGNGGNSANALHYATDWSKGLFISLGKPMVVSTLSDNIALFSALSNDIERNLIFSFQLEMNAKPGEIVLLLSAGGNSQNIAEAAKLCRKRGLTSIGLIGGILPSLKSSFDYEWHIPSEDIQLTEDLHAIFGHMILRDIESRKRNSQVD